MSIWENQPKEFQESIANSISVKVNERLFAFRWSKKERSEKRKGKIKKIFDVNR